MTEEWRPYIRYGKTGTGAIYLKTFVYISNFGNVKGYVYNCHKFTQDDIQIKQGRRYLRRYPIFNLMWKLFNGSITKGCDLHHIDKNKLNDRLDNLVMITKAEHIKLHPEIFVNSEETKQKKKAHLSKYKNNALGKHFYNNGQIEILAKEQPDGFVNGRLRPAWNKGLKSTNKK